MADRLGMRKPEEFKLLWVTDFPLFEYDEEGNRWVARHHPFTSPKPEDIEVMINNNPLIENAEKYLEHPYSKIKANAYDIVLNGNEIGGGSIRIFQRELQEKMFAALGMSKEEAQHKFGFLLGAFEYGAPPHGGIAFGFDRLCAILGGSESIRDFIAFPKNNSGRDVMIDAPSTIDEKQFEELQIKLDLKKSCTFKYNFLIMIIEIPKGTPEKKVRALLKKKKVKQNPVINSFFGKLPQLEDGLKIQKRLRSESK